MSEGKESSGKEAKAGEEAKDQDTKETEAKKEKDEKCGQEEEIKGITEGALHALGRMAPGFGDLIKGLEKSDAFQERIKAANAEMEKQIKKAPPLRKVEGSRASIIPPKTTLKVSRSILDDEEDTTPPHGGWRSHNTEGERSSPSNSAPQPQREVITDVFDEGDHIKIVAELPGVEEKDISIAVDGKHLGISAEVAGRKYHKELELPSQVETTYQSSCKNGILQIVAKKKTSQ